MAIQYRSVDGNTCIIFLTRINFPLNKKSTRRQVAESIDESELGVANLAP